MIENEPTSVNYREYLMLTSRFTEIVKQLDRVKPKAPPEPNREPDSLPPSLTDMFGMPGPNRPNQDSQD